MVNNIKCSKSYVSQILGWKNVVLAKNVSKPCQVFESIGRPRVLALPPPHSAELVLVPPSTAVPPQDRSPTVYSAPKMDTDCRIDQSSDSPNQFVAERSSGHRHAAATGCDRLNFVSGSRWGGCMPGSRWRKLCAL